MAAAAGRLLADGRLGRRRRKQRRGERIPVKAAFIYNFTKFTDWPANAFPSAAAPLVIGIVGEDPFGKTIDDVVNGEVVRDRPLVVKRLRADGDLRSCHVLFISRSEKDRLRPVTGPAQRQPGAYGQAIAAALPNRE